jgi:SAM-dependent methyltransferase
MNLEFTGERYVPGVEGFEDLYAEHMSRYLLAARWAGQGAVLDVGCGCGYGASHLAAAGASVLGVDVSPEAIGFAQEHYRRPGLAFAVMDARALAVEGPFDVVTCFEVIEHVDDAPRVLDEIAKVLADDGILVVSTPDKATYVAGGPDGKNPFHVREYTRSEFESLLKAAYPRVRMLDQAWCEGIMIGTRGEKPPASVDTCRLPEERPAPPDSEPGGPTYFVAACGKTATVDRTVDNMAPFFIDTGLARYKELKRQARKLRLEFDQRAAWAARLSTEFDQRSAWAAKLNEEVRARDATIKDLRARLAKVEREFDERGAWAQGLSEELESQRARARQLAARLEHLGLAGRITGNIT